MANLGLSIGCCCGCNIFAYEDVLDAEVTGVTVIDGFTVIEQSLPRDGLWFLELDPKVSGSTLSSEPIFEFRLLRPDHSVFAEWSLGYRRYETVVKRQTAIGPPAVMSDVNVIAKQVTFNMDWNGTLIDDEKNEVLEYQTELDVEATGLSVFPMTIVGRKECSSIIGGATQKMINDTVQNFTRRYLVGGEFGFVSEGSSPALDDSDNGTKIVSFDKGFPLANDAEQFAAAGPLRLAIKFNADPEPNEATCSVGAGRIYQEEILCADIEERNTECDLPVICPVTFPHYTTPMWDLIDVSADVSLYSVEEAEMQFDNCISRNVFRRIGTSTEYTMQVNGGPFAATFPDLLMFDAIDHPATFSHNYPGTLADTCLVFESPSPGVYNFGPDLNFRSEYFPWQFQTQIVATESPCQWRVDLTVTIFARVCSGIATYEEVITYSPIHDTVGYFSNPQYPYDRFNTPKQAVEGDFLPVEFTFSKVVDRWSHQPPILTFDASDQTSSTSGNVYFLKRLFNPRVVSLGVGTALMRVDAEFTTIAKNSIEITIGPKSAPRVPHP